MKLRTLAIIAALALPTLAIADDTTTKSTDKAAKLSANDVKVVALAHHVNQVEIDVGKAAQKNGTAAVKSYGETLVTDHQNADKELTALGKQHGLSSIPADKPDTDAGKQEQKDLTAAIAHLKTLKGAAFDKEFLSMMVADHEKQIARIDAALATSGSSDPDLQAWLKSYRLTLQRHLDQARDLQKAAQTSSIDHPGTKQPTR
jgi:putative membrane protein